MSFGPPRSRFTLPERIRAQTAMAVVKRPEVVLSAQRTLDDLDLQGWQFHKAAADANPASSSQVRVDMPLSTLVRLLTTPVSDEQRHEWARRLALECQERLPDATLQHLYTSIGRESWEQHRLNEQRKQQQQQKQRQEQQRQRQQRQRQQGSRASAVDPQSDREALAAELNHITAQIRKAILQQKRAQAKLEQQASKADVVAPANDLVSETTFEPDALRAAAATHSSLAPDAVAGGADGSAPPIRSLVAHWAVPAGGDGTRMQATLRFEPGVVHGDRVVVSGPKGESMPLIVPPGVTQVVKVAVASLPDVNKTSGPRSASATFNLAPREERSVTALVLDVIHLDADAAPGRSLIVNGVQVVLPPHAAPHTSILLAFPLQVAPAPPQQGLRLTIPWVPKGAVTGGRRGASRGARPRSPQKGAGAAASAAERLAAAEADDALVESAEFEHD